MSASSWPAVSKSVRLLATSNCILQALSTVTTGPCTAATGLLFVGAKQTQRVQTDRQTQRQRHTDSDVCRLKLQRDTWWRPHAFRLRANLFSFTYHLFVFQQTSSSLKWPLMCHTLEQRDKPPRVQWSPTKLCTFDDVVNIDITRQLAKG